MLYKLFTIAHNTFVETLRQPFYAIIIFAALFAFFMSPPLTMYSISDDNKLLREIGLSTLFLAGLFISIFSASSAVSEEIETQTVSTVLSKPVQRPIFIIGKFLGVAAAVALAHYLCTIAFLMTMRHGVLEVVDQPHDWTVLAVTIVAVIGTLLLTSFFNYSYDWNFSSTAVLLLAIFATLGMVFLGFIDPNWQFNPGNNAIGRFDIYASTLLLLAFVVLVAMAVAFSTRFNVVITLACCSGVFLLGLISDYVFGRFAETLLWAKIGRVIVPNLQVFWISDAIYEGSAIPLKYILMSAVYAGCYATAILFLSVALFQRRQIG